METRAGHTGYYFSVVFMLQFTVLRTQESLTSNMDKWDGKSRRELRQSPHDVTTIWHLHIKQISHFTFDESLQLCCDNIHRPLQGLGVTCFQNQRQNPWPWCHRPSHDVIPVTSHAVLSTSRWTDRPVEVPMVEFSTMVHYIGSNTFTTQTSHVTRVHYFK